MLHGEIGQLPFKGGGKPRPGCPTKHRQPACRVEILLASQSCVLLQLRETFGQGLERVPFLPERGVPCDDVRDGRAVLPFEPLERRQSVFDLLQSGRGRVDARRVPAEKAGQVLEL